MNKFICTLLLCTPLLHAAEKGKLAKKPMYPGQANDLQALALLPFCETWVGDGNVSRKSRGIATEAIKQLKSLAPSILYPEDKLSETGEDEALLSIQIHKQLFGGDSDDGSIDHELAQLRKKMETLQMIVSTPSWIQGDPTLYPIAQSNYKQAIPQLVACGTKALALLQEQEANQAAYEDSASSELKEQVAAHSSKD